MSEMKAWRPAAHDVARVSWPGGSEPSIDDLKNAAREIQGRGHLAAGVCLVVWSEPLPDAAGLWLVCSTVTTREKAEMVCRGIGEKSVVVWSEKGWPD